MSIKRINLLEYLLKKAKKPIKYLNSKLRTSIVFLSVLVLGILTFKDELSMTAFVKKKTLGFVSKKRFLLLMKLVCSCLMFSVQCGVGRLRINDVSPLNLKCQIRQIDTEFSRFSGCNKRASYTYQLKLILR